MARIISFPALLAALSLFSGSFPLLAEEVPSPGAKIYAKKCANCHGGQGEGTDDYPDPLVGDKSVRELTDLIDKTMPEGEPEHCQGEEARQVAEFIHQEFYSIIAQERNRPATIEFSRLTVRQYENAVADLFSAFRGMPKVHEKQGLQAEYFQSRRFRRDQRVIERTDPVVNFQFGEGLPDGFPAPEEIKEDDTKKRREKEKEQMEFSIKWQGSVIAPATGDYEFVVETENGFRLWVNDNDTPLIDAWVKSGEETVFRGQRRLLGGRAYPIRLEYFRYREKTSSVQLKWKTPHHTEELIAERHLSPDSSPEGFVLNTSFPPDDRSIGYERGSSISPEWNEATTYAALEIAGYVTDHLNELARSKPQDGNRSEKLKEFSRKFVETAYRRDLKPDELDFYVNQHFAEGVESETAVKRVVLLTLKSPRFLYREMGVGPFDDFDTASWLSFTLWDSLPDQQLIDFARKGELHSRDQVSRQVDRMLQDPRAQAKMAVFLKQWLNIEHFPELIKDSETYPGFDAQLVSDLHSSLNLTIKSAVSSPETTLNDLLLSNQIYLNGRLAQFYGADLPEDAPFQPVSLNPEARAGLITHPLLLSGYAYDKTSSPIHRGVFLSRSLLGRRLKTPPIAVAPLAPDLNPELNTRERVALQTSPEACQTCHVMINSLGFSLENFDAAGRFRTTEKDRPIDASGHYINRAGEDANFNGSRELAEFLASCPETHEAFAEQMFQYFVKQPVRAFGQDRLGELRNSFQSQGLNIRNLLREIAVSSSMLVRKIDSQSTASTE